ncbi:hypothetical protein ACOMHN_005861 [Nucella lapillus]
MLMNIRTHTTRCLKALRSDCFCDPAAEEFTISFPAEQNQRWRVVVTLLKKNSQKETLEGRVTIRLKGSGDTDRTGAIAAVVTSVLLLSLGTVLAVFVCHRKQNRNAADRDGPKTSVKDKLGDLPLRPEGDGMAGDLGYVDVKDCVLQQPSASVDPGSYCYVYKMGDNHPPAHPPALPLTPPPTLAPTGDVPDPESYSYADNVDGSQPGSAALPDPPKIGMTADEIYEDIEDKAKAAAVSEALHSAVKSL